jgi:hemerythrin-like domain-containing protein
MGMDRPNDQTTGTNRPGVMTESGVSDAISLLTADHRTVDRLFKRYEELGSGNEDERGRLVDEISDELLLHAAIEEAIFYPAIRQLLAGGDEIVEEALHEHQDVRDNLAELEGLEAGLARFDATVATLISNVRHHIHEEEGEIFPKLRTAIGQPQLVELGRRMTQAKEEGSGSLFGTPVVSVSEEDIVVSIFEVPEAEPEPEPSPAPRRAPTRPRTAKRPTSKRPTRRLAQKSTSKKSTAKRVAAKRSTAKKSAKRSTAKKSTSRKASVRRSAARKSASARKAAATRRASAAKKSASARKAAATRRASAAKKSASARKAAATRKSRARKAVTARKSPARSRARSRTSASRGGSSRKR